MVLDVGKIMVCEPNVNEGFSEFPLCDIGQVMKEADILVVLVVLVDPVNLRGLQEKC